MQATKHSMEGYNLADITRSPKLGFWWPTDVLQFFLKVKILWIHFNDHTCFTPGLLLKHPRDLAVVAYGTRILCL